MRAGRCFWVSQGGIHWGRQASNFLYLGGRLLLLPSVWLWNAEGDGLSDWRVPSCEDPGMVFYFFSFCSLFFVSNSSGENCLVWMEDLPFHRKQRDEVRDQGLFLSSVLVPIVPSKNPRSLALGNLQGQLPTLGLTVKAGTASVAGHLPITSRTGRKQSDHAGEGLGDQLE